MNKKRKGGAERDREKNKKLPAKCAEKCNQLDSFFLKGTPTEVTGNKDSRQLLVGYSSSEDRTLNSNNLESNNSKISIDCDTANLPSTSEHFLIDRTSNSNNLESNISIDCDNVNVPSTSRTLMTDGCPKTYVESCSVGCGRKLHKERLMCTINDRKGAFQDSS